MQKRSWSRLLLANLVALAVVVAPLAIPSAHAQQDPRAQARVHFQKGKDLYGQGQYEAAIAEFAAADNLAPAPMLEFNIALCYERLGDRAEALRRFQVYLRELPDAPNRAAVEGKIARIEAELREDERMAKQATEPAAPTGPTEAPAPSVEVKVGVTPPAVEVEGSLGAPIPAPPAAEPAHGDPELARVAAIDVASIRDQRLGGAPPLGEEAGPGTEPGVGEPPPADEPKEESTPLYKQWWFWVVVGVSAIILIDFAISDDSDSTSRLVLQPELTGAAAAPQTRGLEWRF